MAKKYINIIKNLVIFCSIMLVLIIISFGFSYSNFIVYSEPYRAIEMHTGKLKYNIKINGVDSNSISLRSGNTFLDLEITSLNEIDSYFKLSYLNNNDINNIYLVEDYNKYILSGETINVKLFVNSNINTIITFNIDGGYSFNGYDSVILSDECTLINNHYKVGDYVNFKPDNKNMSIYKEVSGILDDQLLNTGDTKFKLLSLNDDGTIDIISEDVVNNISLSNNISSDNYSFIMNSISSLYSSADTLSTNILSINTINKYSELSDDYKKLFNENKEYLLLEKDDNSFNVHSTKITNKTFNEEINFGFKIIIKLSMNYNLK